MIHTPCKDCIFAFYTKDTQIGCNKGCIKQYEKLGVDIREVYDDDKEFFVIEGRHCIYYREQNWATWEGTDKDYFEKVIAKLTDELKVKYSAVVFIQRDQTFEDAKSTISSIFNSSILPTEIIVCYEDVEVKISNKNGLPSFSQDFVWCQQNCQGIKVSIEYPARKCPFHEMLSRTVSKCKNSYLLLEAGQELDPNLMMKVNDKLTEDLYAVAAAKHADNSYHELFAFKGFHNHVGGFGKKTVQEKIDDMIEDANTPASQAYDTDDKEFLDKAEKEQERKQELCKQMFLIHEQI